MGDHLLVIDEGTTSTRAIVFNRDFEQVALSQEEIALTYPADGWVEQDGGEIWTGTLAVCRDVIAKVGGVDAIAGIGITNQRETTLIWDRKTLEPIAPAIVWQDRRTAILCEALRDARYEARVTELTGLLLDPYFSATKIDWLLNNVDGARDRANAGDLAFGTVDTYLIARLTGGRVHATDVTNASRTLLARLGFGAAGGWSEELCAMFGVPQSVLPEIMASSDHFGETDADLFGKPLPILSAIGDQQAALVGQGCLRQGQAKITYGTGAFLVANTGEDRPTSDNKLLGTIGFDMKDPGAFALEGSIFNAGTVTKWLRDEMGFFADAEESDALARSVTSTNGVYFVPAFTGLGAPWWNAEARGAITGLTRDSSRAHIARAGLESAGYQTRDLLDAFAADGVPVSVLKVDGGMANNDYVLQFIADICGLPVERPAYTEMTALGAAALAAIELGWMSADDWAERPRPMTRFDPKLPVLEREQLYAGWQKAVQSCLG